MNIKPNIPIKLYSLLVLMLLVILITGIYGIRELNTLNQITEKIYIDHSNISEMEFRASEDIYRQAKRNSYIFLFLSLSFSILLGIYVIKNVRHLIKSLRLTNKQIIQREIRFQELMKYTGDSIFMTDTKYQITAMNDSACKLLGYSREELLNRKIVEFMTTEQQKTFASRIKIIDTEGGSLHERTFVKKDGTLVETEVNVRSIKGIGYISVIRDITDRKETEIKILENDERYKSIISVSNTGGWEYHDDTDYLWCSPEYFLMLGRKQSDYDFSGAKNLKETWVDLLHPDDRKRAINHFAEYLKNGSVGTYESYFRMLHIDGSWVWIWSRGQTLRDTEGKLTPLTVGTHIDITERKKIERELTEKKEQLSLFIEHSPASLAMFDTEMRYIATSRRWTNDYNLGNQNIIGKTHYEVFPEITQDWKDIHQRCLKGAVERNEEDSFERLDGSKEWIRWEIRPWHKSSGEIGGIIMFTEVITERKESEILFKNLVEKSLVGVYIVQKGKFVYVNPKFAHYLGYTLEEMLNIDNFRDIVDESYIPTELEQWRKKVDVGIIDDFHIELKYKRKDGEIIWADVFCGETIYKGSKAILGSFQDITERKKSELLFKYQFENSPDIILIINRDFTIETINKSVVSSYPVEGLIGKNSIDVLPEESREHARKAISQCFETGVTSEIENSINHNKWVRSRFVPITIDGTITHIMIIATDITERKNSEATIKEQAEIFTAIIENANEAIWLLSPDLTVLQFNKTLQERIRLNGGKEIYLGANFKDFLYTGSENEFMTMFNEALKGNYPEKELCQTNIHGKVFWIRSRMYPVYDIQKKLMGVAILTENITDRKVMESERQKILDEMLQRNRDLEQFTYIISHNLRSPVANIIGISNYMQNTEMDSEESEEMNNGLRTSVLKLDGVINDLNNILKVKREISEKKEMVKFSDLVNNIKTSIVNLIEKEDVTFILDFTAVEEMETIKSYLHSIFYNLISNSIKYRRPNVKPIIEIRTNFVEGKLEITYKDNGLGIDLEKKGDQVFGLYKRFHTHAEGKGMGLYMVKTQVETLGGTISLESEINKGTTFKIKFEIEKNNN